jgi:flagellar protein FlgJ
MSVPATQFDTNVFDTRALADIRRQAKDGDPQAIKAAARQFEALFLQMVLKSMRDATPKEGLFDSEQTRLYESLLDQQLAQVMAGSRNGTGLAALIEKQLSRAGTAEADAFPEGLPLLPPGLARRLEQAAATQGPAIPAAPAPATATGAAAAVGTADTGSPRDFLAAIWPHAETAGRSIGIPPAFLVAQAALETGWGCSEPRLADGRPSHNLFGIKAGASWRGPVAEAATTEYVNGVAETRVERFRAYGSYAEAFQDYASLLAGSPRYAAVLGATEAASFARGLQRAGYATDPAYGAKLERIINGQTLRTALAA